MDSAVHLSLDRSLRFLMVDHAAVYSVELGSGKRKGKIGRSNSVAALMTVTVMACLFREFTGLTRRY